MRSQFERTAACLPRSSLPDRDGMDEELHYRIIKLIEQNPEISQRQLAKAMGISLGKANYCIKAVLEKGLIKARNSKNSQNKLAYAYFLTPKGIDEKARITARFLNRKLEEYETLKQEIEELRSEVSLSDTRNRGAGRAPRDQS